MMCGNLLGTAGNSREKRIRIAGALIHAATITNNITRVYPRHILAHAALVHPSVTTAPGESLRSDLASRTTREFISDAFAR